MLKIAIAATLNGHDDLLLKVVRRADPSVAESVRIVMQNLVRPD